MTFLALSLFAATICSPANVGCETPIPVDSIADSVGVNIHLHSTNTVYGNFSLIETLLASLGVRHTRDGLIDTAWNEYYLRHIALSKIGIKCLFITSPSQSEDLLVSWPSRVPGAFEGYEAPNEYDLSRDPNWANTLLNFIPRLYRAAKSNAATANFTIVGPSLTQSAAYDRVAGLQQYFEFANMHNYFGGRNPGTSGWGDGGYGSIDYNLKRPQAVWPGKLIMTTETGYLTDIHIDQGIPELVEGKYAPRMVLEQALHGITRTYIYELIDEGIPIAGNSGAYGLARIDGSPKPAFVALKSLIATLADPGPHPLPKDLQYNMVGASQNVHHLLMTRNDGSYYLAFWLEQLNYDVNKHSELPVIAERFTFASNQLFKKAELITFDAKGVTTTTHLAAINHIGLTATDCISILVLR